MLKGRREKAVFSMLPPHHHAVPTSLRLLLASGFDCWADDHHMKCCGAGWATALVPKTPPPPTHLKGGNVLRGNPSPTGSKMAAH